MPILNATTGLTVCQDVQMARTWWARTRGLIGRPALASGQGLWLEPCQGVHMFFMRHHIDVIFLDGDGVVVALREDLRPWRMTRIYPEARVALELPPGGAAAAGVAPGHRLVRIGV